MPNASAAGTIAPMSAAISSIRNCAGVACRICSVRASRAIMRKWLALAGAIVVLDQITKFLIVQNFILHESLRITSFFNIVRVHNTGASFSMLANAGGWQRWFFIAVAVIASAWVIWLLLRHP